MRRIAMVGVCLAVMSAPAFAQHRGGGGGGGAFLGGALGGLAGSVVGNALTRPAEPQPVYVAPAPVYVAPPVYMARPVYVAPSPAWTLQAQMRLHDLGLLVGPVDGVFGISTRHAIMNWQALHNLPASGYLSDDEVPMLLNASMTPVPVPAPAMVQTAPVPVSVPAPAVVAPAVAVPAVAAVATPAVVVPVTTAPPAPVEAVAATQPADPVGGIKDGMAYGQARQRLLGAGWQTGYFTPANISDNDRDNRAYFVDHHINEVEDCSSSGCAMQFHNNDGRLLYVFTETGSRTSDAYHGAGPAVIGFCLDHKDLACAPAPQAQATR